MLLTGGEDTRSWKNQDLAYALEVATGNWKPKHALPHLNIPRKAHGSCVVGGALYVIAGYTDEGTSSTIEMIRMKLNDDLSFGFLGESWSLTHPVKLTTRCFPFVSAIGKNSILIYGGIIYDDENYESCVSGGLIIDMDKATEHVIPQEDLHIYGDLSHGVLNRFGLVVGAA